MRLQTKILINFFLVFTVFLIPFFLYAEMEIGVIDNQINIETIPENPEPYQNVTIKITSFATDLNKATIEWISGSNVVSSGIGKTSYSFKALGPEIPSVFDVQIIPFGSFSSVNKRVIIIPTEIEVMWEAVDGYTPPFYRGKSFVSAEGLIKVVAIPSTNTIKSGKGNIVYSWKNGDNTQLDASGYNKDSYKFANNILNEKEIVTV